MVLVDSWLARISRLRNWRNTRLTTILGWRCFLLLDMRWPFTAVVHISIQLNGADDTFLSVAWALLVLVDSITWEANWELVLLFRLAFCTALVFFDFHSHSDRRLRSLTSRAPADQKKIDNKWFGINKQSLSIIWQISWLTHPSRQFLPIHHHYKIIFDHMHRNLIKIIVLMWLP